MPEQERILNRIKKMFALASDAATTEGERDNALRMAYATMQKHNLDMAQVDGFEARKPGAEDEKREKVQAAFVHHAWARGLGMAVGELFFCSYYFSRNARSGAVMHNFIGRTANAVTAAYMAEYLARSIDRESARSAPFARRDFAKGATSKVIRRCHDLRKAAEAPQTEAQPGTALVLRSLYGRELVANEKFLEAAGTSLKKSRGSLNARDRDAFHSGMAYGAGLSLDRQVK